MKNNSLILKLSLFFLVWSSSLAQAQQNFLKPPVAPVDEVCKEIEVMTHGDSNSKIKQLDPACLERNTIAKRNYAAAVEVYNRTSRMITADASTLKKPIEPNYKVCGQDSSGYNGPTVDFQCQAENAKLKQDYDLQMMGWSKYQQEQQANDASAATAENQQLQQIKQQQSATAALAEAREKALYAQGKSNSAANRTKQLAINAGVAYGISCMGFGACNWKFLAASIAFGMMSSQHGRQASYNGMQAYNACTTQAQLSSSSTDCGPMPQAYDPGQALATNPVIQNFDSNGKCIATDKSKCTEITASLPPGTNMKDIYKGASSFAAAPPYKINSDGSVTLKNGKTLKEADFTNKDALKAAGLSNDQALAFMDGYTKAITSPGLEKLAKKDLKNSTPDQPIEIGGFNMTGSGTNLDADSKTGSKSNYFDSLSSKDIEGTSQKRSPAAAEGLTRDFNGESIGASGDDIFSMMNRRYKMKNSQDSFLSN